MGKAYEDKLIYVSQDKRNLDSINRSNNRMRLVKLYDFRRQLMKKYKDGYCEVPSVRTSSGVRFGWKRKMTEEDYNLIEEVNMTIKSLEHKENVYFNRERLTRL